MKRAKKLVSITLIIAVFLASALPCVALKSNSNTVRVGYFDCGDYYTEQKDGKIKSYDVSYLEKISKLTNYKFQYVNCGSWASAMSMLSNHEIDLLGTMQKSNQREADYAICENSYGTTAAELVTLPDSKIVFEDFPVINKSKLGILKGYVREGELKQYLKSHSINPSLFYYDTQEDLFDALKNGNVNIIAANSHTVSAKWKVVGKFYYNKLYFASWKNNEQLVKKIDNALLELSLYEPNLQGTLQNKYFPSLMIEPFTKSQLDFISKQPEISVYINDGSAPLASLKNDGKMQGILVDICNMIHENTGLKFNYCPITEKPKNPKGNYIVINLPESGASSDIVTSNSFFNTSFLMYYRNDNNFTSDKNASYHVVIPQNRSNISEYIKSVYPHSIIEELGTPEECIKAVVHGSADLTMLNSYLVDEICKRKDITNLYSIPSLGLNDGFCMMTQGPDSNELTNIINKGIASIDKTKVERLQLQYALNTTPDMTFSYYLKNYAHLIIIFIILSFLAIGAFIYARMLKKKNAAIEKATQAKSEFLSTMSHDIRTPMNAIINITKLAQEECSKGNLDIALSDLKQIGTVSDFLMGLLNDVLDMSSIESGKLVLHPTPYYYSDFLKQLNVLFGQLCAQKNVNFCCEEGNTNYTIYVDKTRFNQVFFNLLSNAVKFTPKGGTVTYRVIEAIAEGDMLNCTFEISDTGCGMSHDFQEHMFEPFERETTTRTAYQGTGLGLPIAKSIVDNMGGTIEVKSEEGRGTSFYVHLSMPIATEEQIEAHRNEEIATNISLGGKRVLVVEDNKINTMVLTRILMKKNMVITEVHNGAEAVDMLTSNQSESFDVILMDIRMPIMDGLEATRRIRELEGDTKNHVPILAMTADAFDNDIEASSAAGMDAHLTKPIVEDILFQTISKYVK